MKSELINNEQFKLANGLIIDLSLDWDSQKKVLGKNLSHTGSSFGLSYPEMILHNDWHHPENWDVIGKDPNDCGYYVLDYENNLSKVRTVKVYNQFGSMITLWQRHGFWSFIK